MMGADWGFLVALTCCLTNVLAISVNTGGDETITHKDILMRGAKPSKPDAYLCTSYTVNEEEAYIVKFEALANADTAHHILMYGCQDMAYNGYNSNDLWSCPPICRGPQQILFAWAKNAPPTQLPDGVGVRIGRRTSVRSIVLQIHYAKSFQANEEPDRSGIRLHISKKKQPYVAGIFLLMSTRFAVPPNQPKYHVDVSCQYRGNHDMVPFAYRTHSHGLGKVITGYQYNDTGYHMIGKGNPQWPQAFYPSDSSVTIKPGDKLVARCTYNSTGMDHTVYVGATHNDEMCNFYIMFYTDASVQNPYRECYRVEYRSLVANMPANSDIPLPPNPLLDEAAHGHHHHHHPSVDQPSPSTTNIHPDQKELSVEPLPGHLEFQSDWPVSAQEIHIGQVGGVATDHKGNVYIFHRGERIWEQNSFDFNDNFQFQDQPIRNNTVMILSREGKLIRQFGSGLFFMPHGISVDDKGNIWLTDVALHQVFKFLPGESKPNMTLGERFVHGRDAAHFCKPTDVAVLSSGDFYVSDGYCNSRVMKFSKNGVMSKEWGRPNPRDSRVEPQGYMFSIPHSITVAEELDLVCVADRENGRIQCFNLEGSFRSIIKKPEFGSRLFALEYCPRHGGLLYAVNGPMFDGRAVRVMGFTISLRNNALLETWNLPTKLGLQNPHDVAVDVEGHAVYVGELNPKAVWKFERQVPSSSTASTATHKPTQKVTSSQHPTAHSADKENKVLPSEDEEEDRSVSGKNESIKSAMSGGLLKESKLKEEKGEESSDFTPSIIIGVLLIIPVVLLLVITLIMRWHHKGWNNCLSGMRKPKVFNLQKLLGNSHRGFDKLSQEDSDHDADVLSDSDNEEFRQPMKSKA